MEREDYPTPIYPRRIYDAVGIVALAILYL